MKRLLILPLLVITFVLSAAPIGEKRAREIATSFFASTVTRSASPILSLEWAGDRVGGRNIAPLSANNQDEAMLYIYNRTDTKGFVVVAGDDGVERSVVAYSHDNHLQMDRLSDGAKYILSGWCKQIAAVRKSGVAATRSFGSVDIGTTEKLYETALWDQGEPFNNEAPMIDGNRAITGCVATAMSIICYYNKWPEYGVGTTPEYEYADNYSGNTHVIPENTLGRSYDYDNMRSDNYSSGYSAQEAAAVAALMKDMGTSVRMGYHYNGSYAYSKDVPVALTQYFGYAKTARVFDAFSFTSREWVEQLKTNIAQYGPTYFSGSNEEGGHAFVLDGYTSANYFHINYGWSGYDNGFYLIPNITYAEEQAALFYLEPDKTGTSVYADGLMLLADTAGNGIYYDGLQSSTTEYRVGEPFQLSYGCIWNIGIAPFSGEVRVALCDKDGNGKEVLCSHDLALDIYYFMSYNRELTITTPIESGDRIRLLSKGEQASDWSWIRRYDVHTVDEIIVSVTAEDIAKSLGVKYDKTTKQLRFTSSYNLTYSVADSSSTTKASGTMESGVATVVDMSTWSVGEYVFSFSRDMAEYKLTIKL